jgi:hypothetical protein
MPVRRLRSLIEAEQDAWLDRDDPHLWAAIETVWELAGRLYSRRFPPGVHKHRTIDELNRQTEEWDNLKGPDSQAPESTV